MKQVLTYELEKEALLGRQRISSDFLFENIKTLSELWNVMLIIRQEYVRTGRHKFLSLIGQRTFVVHFNL